MRKVVLKVSYGRMVLSLFALFISTGLFAQLQLGSVGQNVMTFSARGGFRLPNMENVEGTPYLDHQYHTARIKTNAGFDTTGVRVKFNAYGNEFIFIENGIELALDSVNFVSYTEFENGALHEVVYKAGFPEIDGFTSNTFYRVLHEGPKFQLLKHVSKRLEDMKSMGEYNKKEFVTREQYYVYTPNNGIKKIKADKKALLEVFPELAQQVETIVAERKLKLKKDSDFAILFEELNKP